MRKYGWLVIFFPLLSFLIIKETWEARLVALSGYLLLLTISVFVWGLNPKAAFSNTNPKKGHELRWLIKERILRVLALIAALLILYFVTYPEMKEGWHVIHFGRSYLLQKEGKVVGNNFNFGAFFLYQTVVVTDKRGSQDDFSAYFFFEPAKVGKTYEFLIMPKTKIILDWSLVQP